MNRKLIAVVLAAAMTLTFAPTVGASEAEVADSITIALSGDPVDLGPFASNSEGRIGVMRTLYEPMMDIDTEANDVAGVLVKDYEMIDSQTYRVEIYDNIHDQDGNPFTASDVQYCYDMMRVLAPNQISAYAGSDVEDDTHIVIHIEDDRDGTGTFESLMTSVNMVTQAAYEASPDGMSTSPVSTSPYRVTSYSSGTSLTMERCDDYWQTPEDTATFSQANVQEVTFMVIPEPSQIGIALETGTIDASVYVQDADMVNFVDDDGNPLEGYSLTEKRDNLLCTVVFNARDRYTADQNIRQAICYCIDAAGVMYSTYGTKSEVGQNFGNGNYLDFDTSLSVEDYYDYDLEKAQELMAEAGYPDGGITVDLVSTSVSDVENMGQLVQAYCAAIGITVNLNVYETALFNSIIYDEEGDWDLQIFTNGASVPYICSMLDQNYLDDTREFGTNISLVTDPELDEAIRVANNVETYSIDNTTAALEVLQDRAYWYNMGSCIKQIVSNDKIKTAAVDYKGQIVPGACEFAS